MALVFVVLLGFSSLGSQAVVQDPMTGIFDGLTPYAELTPNERLSSPGSGWMSPWIYDFQYYAIDAMKPWNSVTKDPLTLYKFSDVYHWLFTEADTTRATETNCLLSSFAAWDTYFNVSTRQSILYYLNNDITTWMENHDNGQYRANVSFSFEYQENGMVGSLQYSAETMVRVDIEPREWYTKSLPWSLRNARLIPNGVCSKFNRLSECFFDENRGYLNSRTTGMLIGSNIKIVLQMKYPDGSRGNATITSKIDYPNIVAWVISKMPVRDPFCPCYDPNPARRPTRFCTYLDKN